MKIDKDILRLEHIMSAIESILERKSEERDRIVERAIMYDLIVIGEAVRNLSENIKAKYNQIPWSDIISLRNRLTHEYFQIDIDVIWKTIDDDIPRLKETIQNIVDELKK